MTRNDEVFAATAADAPMGRGTRLSMPVLAAPADTHAEADDERQGSGWLLGLGGFVLLGLAL
jgi:hypothetical protein